MVVLCLRNEILLRKRPLSNVSEGGIHFIGSIIQQMFAHDSFELGLFIRFHWVRNKIYLNAKRFLSNKANTF